MGTVLLQILVERHGLLHHLLVQHRGIEQMQPVGLPYGKAEMGNVETSLFTGDGNDVTIFYGLTKQRLILHHLLRDITETSTRNALLHLTDGKPHIPDVHEVPCSFSDADSCNSRSHAERQRTAD